jgi:hypothetical protein
MSPVVLGGSQSGTNFRGPQVPGAAGSLALLAGSGPDPRDPRPAPRDPGSGSTIDPADIRPRPPDSPRTGAVDDLYT